MEQIIKNKKDIILKEVKINDLKKYSQVFIKYFSQIFNKENKFIKVIIYPKIVIRFSIFELVICDKKPNIDIEIKENVEINIKYEGYINKVNKEVVDYKKLESKRIPNDIDYDKIINLASEAKQKLKEVKPETLAQALRISGVNPIDISLLSIYIKKEN